MTATLDRPRAPSGAGDRTPDTEVEPKPKRTKRWWQRGLPWPRGRTRNGAPFEDDPLVIANQTDAFWGIHLGFRDLGTVAPRAERREHVVKTGILTARIVGAPAGTDYLTVDVGPHTARIEIYAEREDGVPEYALRVRPRDADRPTTPPREPSRRTTRA